MNSSNTDTTIYRKDLHSLKIIESRFKEKRYYEAIKNLSSFMCSYISEENYQEVLESLYLYSRDLYYKFTNLYKDPFRNKITFDEINRENINDFIEYLEQKIIFFKKVQIVKNTSSNILYGCDENGLTHEILGLKRDISEYSGNEKKQMEYIYHFMFFNVSSQNVYLFLDIIRDENSGYGYDFYNDIMFRLSGKDLFQMNEVEINEYENLFIDALIENKDKNRHIVFDCIEEDIDTKGAFNLGEYMEEGHKDKKRMH